MTQSCDSSAPFIRIYAYDIYASYQIAMIHVIDYSCLHPYTGRRLESIDFVGVDMRFSGPERMAGLSVYSMEERLL